MREIQASACVAPVLATVVVTVVFGFGCTPAAGPSPNNPSTTGETPESDPNASSGGGGAGQGPFASSTGESSTGDGESSTTAIATKTPCGGLSGAKCGEGSTCIDDPSDACDPSKGGGAECTGICVSLSCGPSKACPAGYKCGDDGTCRAVKLVTCGGLELKPCPGGTKCIDDATDGCDPKSGGVSCPGVCMPQ
jgi:hypothetical protein